MKVYRPCFCSRGVLAPYSLHAKPGELYVYTRDSLLIARYLVVVHSYPQKLQTLLRVKYVTPGPHNSFPLRRHKCDDFKRIRDYVTSLWNAFSVSVNWFFFFFGNPNADFQQYFDNT